MQKFELTQDQGKAVQEVLRRYVTEELEPRLRLGDFDAAGEAQKDINYINDLINLFE